MHIHAVEHEGVGNAGVEALFDQVDDASVHDQLRSSDETLIAVCTAEGRALLTLVA
jgi:hypothetical protein